jgi:hypothetical protein
VAPALDFPEYRLRLGGLRRDVFVNAGEVLRHRSLLRNGSMGTGFAPPPVCLEDTPVRNT